MLLERNWKILLIKLIHSLGANIIRNIIQVHRNEVAVTVHKAIISDTNQFLSERVRNLLVYAGRTYLLC